MSARFNSLTLKELSEIHVILTENERYFHVRLTSKDITKEARDKLRIKRSDCVRLKNVIINHMHKLAEEATK